MGIHSVDALLKAPVWFEAFDDEKIAAIKNPTIRAAHVEFKRVIREFKDCPELVDPNLREAPRIHSFNLLLSDRPVDLVLVKSELSALIARQYNAWTKERLTKLEGFVTTMVAGQRVAKLLALAKVEAIQYGVPNEDVRALFELVMST